jgi:hypothetical protein
MRRLAVAIPVILMTLAVSACGGSSFTLKVNSASGGNYFTLVATGDPKTIAAEKTRMPAGTTTDGDTHTGNKICETDVNDAGLTFHAVVYATTSLPGSFCNTIMNGING